jgi:hypothetical protein
MRHELANEFQKDKENRVFLRGKIIVFRRKYETV